MYTYAIVTAGVVAMSAMAYTLVHRVLKNRVQGNLSEQRLSQLLDRLGAIETALLQINIALRRIDPDHSDSTESSHRDDTTSNNWGTKAESICKLASRGFTAREIAERSKLSIGEVELVLALNRAADIHIRDSNTLIQPTARSAPQADVPNEQVK